MIAYVLPTHNRPQRLEATLAAIGSLADPSPFGGAEVIVVDNASEDPPKLSEQLLNGTNLKTINLKHNIGAAARNIGVREADPASNWIIMLDDDSYPADSGFARVLMQAGSDVAAISADIFLPEQLCRESGGLPEVFIGCGVAFRREAFEQAGGYDKRFNYYVEEYDLAARMLLDGGRIAFDPWFRVQHHKVQTGRDMNLILERLIRNNGWVAQRYAPDDSRRGELRELRTRYRRIAAKEGALEGYARGLVELKQTLRDQARNPLSQELWDRFTGLAHARRILADQYAAKPFSTVAMINPGKNMWVIRHALQELGVQIVDQQADPEALVVATMSPGPMLDAFERQTARHRSIRVLTPWCTDCSRHAATADMLFTPVSQHAGELQTKIPA